MNPVLKHLGTLTEDRWAHEWYHEGDTYCILGWAYYQETNEDPDAAVLVELLDTLEINQGTHDRIGNINDSASSLDEAKEKVKALFQEPTSRIRFDKPPFPGVSDLHETGPIGYTESGE